MYTLYHSKSIRILTKEYLYQERLRDWPNDVWQPEQISFILFKVLIPADTLKYLRDKKLIILSV